MRNIFVVGLVITAVVPASAQSAGTIRRRVATDSVLVQIDSLHAQLEALRNAEGMIELRQMPMLFAQGQQLPRTLSLNTEGLRTAARGGELSARGMRRTPRFGINLSYDPHETDRYGAYVTAVTPGGPADRAGLVAGDVITRIGNKSLARESKGSDDAPLPAVRATEAIAGLTAGKSVEVDVRRGSASKTLHITPIEDAGVVVAGNLSAAMPTELLDLSREMTMPRIQSFGNANATTNGFSFGFNNDGRFDWSASSLFSRFELAPLNEKLGSYFGATEGVLVVNDVPTRIGATYFIEGTPARTSGSGATSGRVMLRGSSDSAMAVARKLPEIALEPGDVIMSVDGRKVSTPSQLMRVVATYDRGDEFKLQIMRQKRQETLSIKMP